MEQRSPEWFAARLGKVTSSRVADAVARTKTGWGASRKNYMAELALERLTGQPTQTYQSQAMLNGIQTEPEARANYEFEYAVTVEEVGFVEHPRIDMAGASPDGFVGNEGLVEIKCPLLATHFETMLKDNIDGDYLKQMQWQMATTGRSWCDYVSYHPALPMRVIRVPRNTAIIMALESDVRTFLAELDAMVEAVRHKYPTLQAAA